MFIILRGMVKKFEMSSSWSVIVIISYGFERHFKQLNYKVKKTGILFESLIIIKIFASSNFLY